MAAFLRPGEKRQGAFGVTFDLDAGASQAVPIFNKNESLALQEQRRRLPAFQHRCLPEVFNTILCRRILQPSLTGARSMQSIRGPLRAAFMRDHAMYSTWHHMTPT